ncbi:MAG: dihydrolipoamide acetyltransferase family protein [Anaerolineales bacterium]|nr:dihydrolipoamide acetyltransferase family protein [Anaerolineales bacterium]
MATKVIMPQLGESVVEGTVTKWLKQEGDSVEEFEPLVEVNTDKVDTEVPSPTSGTLLKLYVEEGETVEAGTLLAFVGEPDESVPAGGNGPAAAEAQKEEKPKQPRRKKEPAGAETVSPGKQEELGFISPVVARIASEENVDLQQVEGTGRDGRITKKDVLTYLETREEAPEEEAPEKEAAPAAAPWEEPASGELFRPTEEVFKKEAPKAADMDGDVIPLDPVRKSIAEHMVRSKRTSPHVTTVMEADLSRVVTHRNAHKSAFERDGVKLTYSAYFAAATVGALKDVPIVNASWTDEGILQHRQVNLGMAVSLGERGLIVPVIKDADEMSLRGLARAINELAQQARQGELSPDDVQGGTFTITNHGVSGSLFATPIINQPQAGILGVGAVQKRPVVVEAQAEDGSTTDALAIRPMAYLTLTFDHRILDGAIADEFLGRVVESLESWS